MNREPIRCVDRGFYSSSSPAGFEEGRALLLSRFLEKELDPSLENRVREHLHRCDCCTQFLKDFESPEDLMVDASCPSSARIDLFLFERDQVSDAEAQRIEKHVAECELCSEEIVWLKNLESQKVIEFIPPKRDWTKVLSVAAALFFVLVSTLLLLQRTSIQTTEQRLQSLAQVKQPDQINFEMIRASSVALPDEMNRLYEEGVSSLKQGRFQDAASTLEKVAEARPDHSATIYLLGYSYYQMRELEKAFALCDRAEQMRPHDLERCLLLVNIALKTGHYGRAINEISGLHHDAPEHPQVKELYEQITSITRGQTIKL